MPLTPKFPRRTFLSASTGATLATLGTPCSLLKADGPPRTSPSNKICAFIKFIQEMPYKQLAETVAELGFDGIEATVRNGGHVLPERVEEDLPKLVEALKACGLGITIMASSVNALAQPHTKKVLRTASKLGITRYRLAYYRYDLRRPIIPQLDALKPIFRDLVAFHSELGLQGLYQNHAGATSVGAPIWDLRYLMEGIPPAQAGIAFDIRHATVEGGQAWPLNFRLARPHLGAIYVKDFTWKNGRKPTNVPLGTGQVDPKFFKQARAAGFDGPLSLHVEYLPKAGLAANVAALKTDLAQLRRLWA